MAPSSLPPFKTAFLAACEESGALKFGSFVLKSKRLSPYFFNSGLFNSFSLTNTMSQAFAQTLHAEITGQSTNAGASDTATAAKEPFDFDILFGPAYKGIVLAATVGVALANLDPARYANKNWSFNRKEAKDHGEGGTIVGAPLKGRRVVIIDDIITAGTAIREAIKLIQAQGGELVGIVLAVDRQEKVVSAAEAAGEEEDGGAARPSAIGVLRKELGVPITAIITLDDVVEYLKETGTPAQLAELEAYRKKYKATD